MDVQVLSIANPKIPEEVPANKGNGVQTGDLSNIGLCMMLLIISGVILLYDVKKYKKQ